MYQMDQLVFNLQPCTYGCDQLQLPLYIRLSSTSGAPSFPQHGQLPSVCCAVYGISHALAFNMLAVHAMSCLSCKILLCYVLLGDAAVCVTAALACSSFAVDVLASFLKISTMYECIRKVDNV